MSYTTPLSPGRIRPPLSMARLRLTRVTLILLLSIVITAAIFFQSSVRNYQDSTSTLRGQGQRGEDPLYLGREENAEALRRHRVDNQWPWLAYVTGRIKGGQAPAAVQEWEEHQHEVEEPDEGEDYEEVKQVQEDSQITFAPDGLVRGWEDRGAEATQGYAKLSSRVKRTHPIYELIKRGNEKWTNLLVRQSKTLPQAVIEYKRRYGRSPPKGFEQWWKYAKRNNIKIVDDYDQINRDIEPYFALSPKTFRDRVKQLDNEPHSYIITLDPKSPSTISGNRGQQYRPNLLFSLLEPIAQYLPESITFHGSDHDLGSSLLGADQREGALGAVREGRYLSNEELRGYEKKGRGEVKGLAGACPVGSRAWNQSLVIQAGGRVEESINEATFVHDPMANYDFCTHPTHLLLHGTFSFDFPRESRLRPLFQWSKHLRSPDILTTPLEAYENHTSPSARNKYTPWTQKSDSRVFWRGSSTGDFYKKEKHGKEVDWRESHRPRLGLLAQRKEGEMGVWMQRGREWKKEDWGLKELNEVYVDVGLTGHPHQCSEEDGTCEEMANEIQFRDRVGPEQAAKFKYVLDVDGNGWSSRFHRLMMSGSVVIKSTIFPEWVSDRLIPWVHHVPIQLDYSDLYNTMAFFAGPPNPDPQPKVPKGSEATNRSEGTDGMDGTEGSDGGPGRSENDHLAQAIAEQARKFGEEHWRWEDMQGYMFRLLLEYTRLMADDRDAASYHRGYKQE